MKLKTLHEARYHGDTWHITTGWISRGMAEIEDHSYYGNIEDTAEACLSILEDQYDNPDDTTLEFIVDELKSPSGMYTTDDNVPVWDFGYDEGLISVMKNRFMTDDDF